MFCNVAELREHVRIDAQDIDFDRELSRLLQSSERRVIAYLNRNVYAEMPAEPLETDIEVNESIKAAILDLAGYYFDNKGNIDLSVIDAILDGHVLHLKVFRCI